jgi:hypothetical protein
MENRFSRKLDELRVRQAMAALASGRWSIPVIAQAFGISIAASHNLKYEHKGAYRKLHAEFSADRDAFIGKHLADEVVCLLNATAVEYYRTRSEAAEGRRLLKLAGAPK